MESFYHRRDIIFGVDPANSMGQFEQSDTICGRGATDLESCWHVGRG